MKRKAFGGVLIDERARVLLVRPANAFDGYVWTFPKGRPEKGETPEATALREVKEETGWDAEIVAPIPGAYEGSTTLNTYFLMRPVGTPTAWQAAETAAIEWVPIEKAGSYLSQTQNPAGRARDLAVLEAARALSN